MPFIKVLTFFLLFFSTKLIHNSISNAQQYYIMSTLPLYKVVMLGDSGVGKSSLVARLTNPEQPLNPSISATMGIEFLSQSLVTTKGVPVKGQIWDTAGQGKGWVVQFFNLYTSHHIIQQC